MAHDYVGGQYPIYSSWKHIVDYPFELRPLMEDEGGGWLVSFPDLPGCMSDGETLEEAMANGGDALAAWLQAAKETGREIPCPGKTAIGQSVTRLSNSAAYRETTPWA